MDDLYIENFSSSKDVQEKEAPIERNKPISTDSQTSFGIRTYLHLLEDEINRQVKDPTPFLSVIEQIKGEIDADHHESVISTVEQLEELLDLYLFDS